MFTDTINRQYFEFTCTAEETARRIQHEIESHTATQINSIISSVFSRATKHHYLKISKLEIDLGNINTHDFGSKEMLSRFEEMLEHQIAEIHRSTENTGSENTNEAAAVISEIENDLEVVESFILEGNVPWWVDKSNPPDVDATVKKMISLQPQALRQLIEQHSANPDVAFRLFTQMKPATVSKIRELMPELSDNLVKDSIIYQNMLAEIDSLSPLQIKRIRRIFYKPGKKTSGDKLRRLLALRLVQFYRSAYSNHISVENTGLEILFQKLNAPQLFSLLSYTKYSGIAKRRNEKKEILELVNKLTVFQAELLLFELSLHLNQEKFTGAEQVAGDLFFDGGETNDGGYPATGKAADTADQDNYNDDSSIDQTGTSAGQNKANEYKKAGEADYASSQTDYDKKSTAGNTAEYPPGQTSDRPKDMGKTAAEGSFPGGSSGKTGNDIPNITGSPPRGSDEGVEKEENTLAHGTAHAENTGSNITLPDEQTTYAKSDEATEANATPGSVDFQKGSQKQQFSGAAEQNNDPLKAKAPFPSNDTGDKAESMDKTGLQQLADTTRASNIPEKNETSFPSMDVEALPITGAKIAQPPGEKEISPGSPAPGETKIIQTKREDTGPGDAGIKSNTGVNTERQTHEKNMAAANAVPAEPGNVQTKESDDGLHAKTTGKPGVENYRDAGGKGQRAAASGNSKELQAKEDSVLARMIAFIMKKLNTSDAAIHQYLLQLDKKHLQHITAAYKNQLRENIELKKTVINLLEHPSLLKYNILMVFANLAPGQEQSTENAADQRRGKKDQERNAIPRSLEAKIKSSKSIFLSYIKQLSVKDLLIIKDIFQKRRFDTRSEKNLVRKILLQLPEENVLFLKFLAELPQYEIEVLLHPQTQSALPINKPAGKEANEFINNSEHQKIYIENAGLCVLALYLPGFFNRLNYLENGVFRNKSFAIRAVYLLQYIVSAQNKSPEYLLQFNKLLCGFRIDDYITKSTRLSKKEISEAGNLLESVIRNWPAIKNTSPNGMRESFLKRKGLLVESESKWTLQVEKRGYDVLLSTIPWGYTMIKFPWMKKLIEVDWQ